MIFYHLHAFDPFSMANFLRYFPETLILMIIRNPIQSCESWAPHSTNAKHPNAYKTYVVIGHRITSMLMKLSSPVFQMQKTAAIRLEDIKIKPKETMKRLCKYLGIKEMPTLYESTMQGLKWWGDPSSSLFGQTQTIKSSDDDPIRAETGRFFSSNDQFVLNTLFYPLSAKFGYVEQNDNGVWSRTDIFE